MDKQTVGDVVEYLSEFDPDIEVSSNTFISIHYDEKRKRLMINEIKNA